MHLSPICMTIRLGWTEHMSLICMAVWGVPRHFLIVSLHGSDCILSVHRRLD